MTETDIETMEAEGVDIRYNHAGQSRTRRLKMRKCDECEHAYGTMCSKNSTTNVFTGNIIGLRARTPNNKGKCKDYVKKVDDDKNN